MKIYNKPSASKLASRFDKQLRNLLMSDLKAMKAKNNNNQLKAA